jgi:predicted acylesterase/phospholipase RssA
MPIKHLVLAGGGPEGFKYYGILKYLNKYDFWKKNDLETIYATSIGCWIAIMITLGYDWDTIDTYLIERPWNTIYNITPKQILDAFYKKGVFNSTLIEQSLKPLFQGKGLDTTITLKEMYDFNNISYHFFTFDVNHFETIDLSYETHPDLSVIDAITMSSTLPGIFMPHFKDDCCYIDGGIMFNYPASYCLNKYPNEDIFGIGVEDISGNSIVTEESNMLELLIYFLNNSRKHLIRQNTINVPRLKYEVTWIMQMKEFTLEYITRIINNKEERLKMIEKGEEYAKDFLENYNKTNIETKKCENIDDYEIEIEN